MKKHVQHIIFCFFALAILASCTSFERQAERFSRQLEEEAARAVLTTERLSHALTQASMDSVLRVANENENVLFYVFNKQSMVFWSNNWLAGQHVYLQQYDTWDFQRFDNALTIRRWTKSGDYNILTVVPIKYAYAFENDHLHNDFLPPFRLPKPTDLRRAKSTSSYPISLDGKYIFSLYEEPVSQPAPIEDTRLTDSFSYSSVLSNGVHHHREVHYYLVVAILFVAIMLLIGLIGIIRFRGLRNMPLGARFQYLIVSLLLFIFVFVFIISTRFVQQRNEAQQIEKLQQRTKYIQKSLQDLYFWNLQLNDTYTAGMNVDLRDLCFTYETDIHVYDLNGTLIGSSSPVVFDKGIISRHIASKPFFSQEPTTITHEHIGDMHYLSAYTELVNGNYVPIGYIQVPLYETEDVLHMALDHFLAVLFPPYFLMMVLSVIFGLFSSRRLTRPLTALTENMKAFRVDEQNVHLNYHRHDEVGALVNEYNKVVDRLQESTEKLARTEREVAWRTMARQIAHEINNPLTPMKLQIQQLQRLHQQEDERFDSFFNRSTAALVGEIDNLSRIASSFSSFAKMPEVQTSQVDISVQLSSVITLFRTNSEHVPVRYIGAEYGVVAKADSEQIRQVFINIIKNAIQAIGDRQNADIIVILKDLNSTVEISISDNGPGIPQEVRDKIFMPNFTTKSTGTGLGLAISKNIVEGSGGTIRFETSEQGTTFFITLKK